MFFFKYGLSYVIYYFNVWVNTLFRVLSHELKIYNSWKLKFLRIFLWCDFKTNWCMYFHHLLSWVDDHPLTWALLHNRWSQLWVPKYQPTNQPTKKPGPGCGGVIFSHLSYQLLLTNLWFLFVWIAWKKNGNGKSLTL